MSADSLLVFIMEYKNEYKKQAPLVKGILLALLIVPLIIFVILVFRSINFSELSGSSLLYSFGRLSGVNWIFVSFNIDFVWRNFQII